MFKLNLFNISENEGGSEVITPTTWWYNFVTFCDCRLLDTTILVEILYQTHRHKFYGALSEYSAKFMAESVEGFGIYDSYITFDHEEDMTRFLLRWS